VVVPSGDPPITRELIVNDVRWTIHADEQDLPGRGESERAITCVWFTVGRDARVAYSSRPAVDVLRSSEGELRALFAVTVSAFVG